MYDGETEPIPRVTDRDEPDKPDVSTSDEPVSDRSAADRPATAHHHHDHSPPLPASRRVRTLVALLLVPFALAAVVGTALLFPFGDGPETQGGAGRPVLGVVTGSETGSCSGEVQVGEQPDAPQCLVVTVRMTDGEAPGQEIRAVVPQEPSTPRFAVDDEVVLSYGGSDPLEGGSYQLVDFQRDVPLALLAGLFAVAVLVLGRWQGLKALVALGLSFLVLVFFVLPAIIAGESPLLVAISGAGVIMFAVLYLTHGFSARTSTAALGTMVSLAMIGGLGALWAAFAKLTGLDEDTATLVGLLNSPIDTRGLLLAGVVIGALGVLDDVTVTQTSAVWELRAANPLLTRRELYTSALRIGRDHVASAVNTLVMAYAGAALPLLLYSSISGVGLGSILTSQSIAQELVRTLVGSIGLVAAVPITTALAAAVASQEPAPEPARKRRPPRETDQAGDRARRRVAQRPGGPGERSAGRPAGRVGERATGRAVESADRANGRARRRENPEGRADQAGDGRAGRARRQDGRTADEPGAGRTRRSRAGTEGRAADRSGDQDTGRPAQSRKQTEGRAADPTSDQDTGRPPRSRKQTESQAADQANDRGTGRGQRSRERAERRAADPTGDQDTGRPPRSRERTDRRVADQVSDHDAGRTRRSRERTDGPTPGLTGEREAGRNQPSTWFDE